MLERGKREWVQLKDSKDGFHLGGPDLEPETHRQMYVICFNKYCGTSHLSLKAQKHPSPSSL